MVLLMVLVLAGCGSSGESSGGTTSTEQVTSTTVACGSVTIGEPHDLPRECWARIVERVLTDEGVTVESGLVDAQAAKVCRAVDSAGPTTGVLTVLADWETGAAPSPADDEPLFVAAAVGVYCPEHYDALRG